MKQFFEISRSITSKGIDSRLNIFRQLIRAFQVIDNHEPLNDHLFMYELITLDADTIGRWEESRGNNKEIPMFKKLIILNESIFSCKLWNISEIRSY